MKRTTYKVVLALWFTWMLSVAQAQTGKTADPPPLRDVKAIQLEPTVVAHPDKVKEESAANLMQDSLRNAFRSANIDVVESAPIRAHIVLNEFTSGSAAKRFMVGFGAGRSTIDCALVVSGADGKELKNIPIRVRGNLAWSPYQGNNLQRHQAVNSFDQRILEEIEKMK